MSDSDIYTVMVTGSRTWTDEDAIEADLREFYLPGARLIHGQCPLGGADEIADSVGRRLGYDVQPYPPNPMIASPRRFHARNDAMLDEEPHVVLAYRAPGRSNGTDSVIEKARERALYVLVRHAPVRKEA